jgi:hypothetical protein
MIPTGQPTLASADHQPHGNWIAKLQAPIIQTNPVLANMNMCAKNGSQHLDLPAWIQIQSRVALGSTSH